MSQSLLQKIPVHLRQELKEEDLNGVEEIRLRTGWPMELYYGTQNIRLIGRVCGADVMEMLNYLTGYSLYAYEEQFKQGFFTIEGGHRVGLVGHTTIEQPSGAARTEIVCLKDISGINIRIARQKKDISLWMIPYIRTQDSIHNTLFVASPGVGKTTYLRDCIRILSSGEDQKAPLKISVVDERSELAASHLGMAQNDLGLRTDVMDNCPKLRGMEMVLRSMSPQIVAVDELGGEEELVMLGKILNSGSRILGTMHAGSLEELGRKAGMKNIMEQKLIGRYVMLEKKKNKDRYATIYDEKLCPICSN